MQRNLIFLACLFICVSSFSQQYPFVHYTPREGLVNNRARSIYQDSKGRLYIATFGGLSIYDGSRFTNYTNENGLITNLVNDVVEMGDDSIWILPNANKIHCLVYGVLKNFTPSDGFTPSINQLVKTFNGDYYAMAEEGLFHLENKHFVKMPIDTVFNGETIKTFLLGIESGNKLYILSNPDYKLPCPNLLVYDLIEKKLLACNKNEWIQSMAKGFGKEVWMSTPWGLLVPGKIDQQNRKTELKHLPYNFPVPDSTPVSFSLVDRQKNVWLIRPEGVVRIRNNQATLFTTENGLSTNSQNFIFQDHENNIWFVNDQTGISKLSNQQLAFYPSSQPGNSFTDLFTNQSYDTVWMHNAAGHKLVLVLPNGQRKVYENPGDTLPYPGRFVSGTKKWITCGVAIYEIQLSDDSRYSLTKVYRDTGPLGFTSSINDKYGNLVTVSDKLLVIVGSKILTAPVHYMSDQLTIDKNNCIWVANRSNQLYCFQVLYNGENSRLTLLKKFDNIAGSSPRSVVADHTGNIWIGTRTAGLFCLHFEGTELRSSKQITMQNGLSENFVSYLYCDNDNNIWACTPSGLDRVRASNKNFIVENITTSNNIYYPIYKIQQTAKGLFWIQSGQGLITYDPKRPPVNNWKPQILFSEILVNNIRVSNNTNASFKYFENNVYFQLSAPTYLDEKQTRFSYLLEGSGNENWSVPSANSTVNLINLYPGHYTLKAKAIFLHGLYPVTETAYSFTILPAWWQTTWFKLILVALATLIIFLSTRFYFKRKLQLQLMAIEKKQAIEKERTRIATDMHDDLGAGLSRIRFLSETIGLKKQKHLPIEEDINSIMTYSRDMIGKMGEIVWALNEKNDSLEDLLSYTRSYAVEYLQENGIDCKVDEPDNIPPLNVSGEFRRNIYLTVKETLHNIVKHAQASAVSITIRINHELSIDIKDNGIGITTGTHTSRGNGLHSMDSRIRQLNGKFNIEKDNGTRVFMHVPLHEI